jgi:hypothetical protein
MENIDLDYNFLMQSVDAKKEEWNRLLTIKREKNGEKLQRGSYIYEMNNRSWIDPDSEDPLLYDYHESVWSKDFPNKKRVNKIEHYHNSYEERIRLTLCDNKNFYLGSDYIGFSKQWITDNVSDEDVIQGLSVTRCFAGHMLWCKGFGKGWKYNEKENKFKYSDNGWGFVTINQARGGACGVFDRIDWTLRLLKVYYSNIDYDKFDERKRLFLENELVKELLKYNKLSEDEKHVIFDKKSKEGRPYNPCSSVCRLFYAFENSREWLMLFVKFTGFIEYFALDDLLDENNNVKGLSDWFPVLPDNYNDYMDNSITFIKLRTNRLKPKVSKILI